MNPDPETPVLSLEEKAEVAAMLAMEQIQEGIAKAVKAVPKFLRHHEHIKGVCDKREFLARFDTQIGLLARLLLVQDKSVLDRVKRAGRG
jgi:hypothetical protein